MKEEQALEKKKKPRNKLRGNGQGSVYKLPNGKYRAVVTLGYEMLENGKLKRICRTKSDFATKKEGINYLPILRNEPVKPENIKFHSLYAKWSEKHYKKISKSKETAYKIAYAKCKPIHYYNIADIRLSDLQEIVDTCQGSYYPKRDIKALCKLMFQMALKDEIISKNCAELIELPPVPKSNRDSFKVDEVAALWKDYEAGNDFTGYILIMIYTGMRYGELSILKKENIFLDENYMIGGIKSEAGIDRHIVIADKIKPIIQKFYDRGKTKLLHMSENNFYEKYYEVLERAKCRRLTPHSCRHTFATLMAEAGIQPAIIKEIAGHEKYETTLQYTHISVTEKLKAINKI